MGRLPPLQLMVGRYLGYKPEAEAQSSSPDDHAKNLISQLTGLG